MDNFEQQNTNNTNVIASEAKDFDGNNVANIIALLLNVYHPKCGIAAYERVLRKVESFLEDCDPRRKQLLLSMIPAPHDVPDHTVKQVFHTTTGFHKLNQRENVSSSKPNLSCDKNASDSKSSLREAFPFRGFPESEISTIYNHAKNVNHLCTVTEYYFPYSQTLVNVNPNSASCVKQRADRSLHSQLNNNPNDWSNKNSKHQMSSGQRYLLNKKYNVPARVNTANASYLPRSSQTVNQTPHSMKTLRNHTEIKANTIARQLNEHVEYESKHRKDTCALDKDKKPDISYMIVDIGENENATIKETIRNDTRKMDVHWDRDQNIVVDADELLAPVRDKLKRSISNFLKRAQEGVSIELPAFPRTRSYPQMGSSNSIHSASKDRKSGTSHKVLGRDFTSRISSSDNDSSSLLKYQKTDVNLGKNKRARDKETKQGAFACVSKVPSKKYNSRKSNEATELQAQRDDSDYITEKKVAIGEEHDAEESIYGCKITGARPNDVNSEDNVQTRSIFQLAAHKKRYYDTLLNVQKAKVAVTNSLASSSSHLTGYDPYYSNHAYQQQQQQQQQKHLYRHQQCHLAAEPQFSACSTTLSGLSSVHDDQYSWPKSDCKYLLLKQLKLERQNLPMYVRNQNDWIRRYVGSAHPYSFTPSGSDPTRQSCVRHKTLEDIVGKLKETERSHTVNN